MVVNGRIPPLRERGAESVRLLASAIARRDMRVGDAGHSPSFTDGVTIHVQRYDDALRSEHEVAVQAALMALGSLAPETMRRLVGRPRYARRYLALEGARALKYLGEQVPGLAPAEWTTIAPVRTHSAEESLAVAGRRLAIPPPLTLFGVLRPALVIKAAGLVVAAEAEAGHVDALITESTVVALDEGTQHLDEAGVSGGILRRKRRNFRSSVRSQDRGNQSDADVLLEGRGARRGRSSILSRMMPARSADPLEVVARDDGQWCYPEWDLHRGGYRDVWCRVAEVLPEVAGDLSFAPPRSVVLQRRLARLGLDLERRRRQLQGHDFDLDALIDQQASVRSGGHGSEMIYVDNARRRPDLAVLILLDVSSSTSDRNGEETVHDVQRRAAAVLVEALAALGDRVAVLGFQSAGRSDVRALRVKSFDEPAQGAVWERLGALVPRDFTRLGAAIRHGTHELQRASGTTRQLLVVLTDGVAYDFGYDRAYGEEDARRALQEATEQGVGCLCLTLNAASDPEDLRRVFGSSAQGVADRLESLPDIAALFDSALVSAQRRRIASLRPHRQEVAS